MSHHYFGLFMESECWGRVKCNSVPHKLRLLSRDAAIFQKFAGRIRAVYLEAILPVVPLGQTEIVQNRRSEERRVGKERRSRCDWSSDVCSSDLDAAIFQKFAGRIRAVYLEAILPVVPLGQTEIVQNR